MKRLRETLQDSAMISVLWAVLLGAIPFSIYLANADELDHYSPALYPFLLALLAACALTLILRFLFPQVQRAVPFFFFFGTMLWARDNLYPPAMSELDGGIVDILQPTVLIISDIVLVGVVGFLAWKVPRKLTAQIAVVVGLLLGAGLIQDGIRSYRHLQDRSTVVKRETARTDVKAPETNIYQFTFDAFSSLVFEELIDQYGLRDEFKDFTFYKNNRTNYFYTAISVPSFMLGEFHDKRDLSKWHRSWTQGGIIEGVFLQGYRVSQYVQSQSMIHQRAAWGRTNLGMMREWSEETYALELSDLWAVRTAPVFLRKRTFHDGIGLATRLERRFGEDRSEPRSGGEKRVFMSAKLFEKMIEDESSRKKTGEYVHGHIYVPHGPYVLDHKGRYVSKPYKRTTETDAVHFRYQATAVLRLIVRFLNELKRQGKYDQSHIVFNSDHGSWEIGGGLAPTKNPRLRKIEKNVRNVTAGALDNQTRALLLVKRAGASSDRLQVSTKLTQLLDLYPTVLDAAGSSPSTARGVSLLDEARVPPGGRKVDVYMGYKQWNPLGKKRWRVIGSPGMETVTFNHFRFSLEEGWVKLDDQRVRWSKE